MGNKKNKKEKPAKKGWHNPIKLYRSKAEKMRQKRWVSNHNESGSQDISDNVTISGDNMDENMSDSDTVNYNDNVNMSDNGDVASNMSDNDTVNYNNNVNMSDSDTVNDNYNVNISDSDTVNHNDNVNISDNEDVALNMSDMDTIGGGDMDINISDIDTVNSNVGVNMLDNENNNVNMNDISENVSGDNNDNTNDRQGHLVITDEGPGSSTSCRPRKTTKGPSRKLPYEPRRPIRTGRLDVMHKSKRSSARLRRESGEQSVDFTPGSGGASTSAVGPQQNARGSGAAAAAAAESADISQVPTRSPTNPRLPLRDDMIRISQENATCVRLARTRSAEPPQADNNPNINYEVLDSKLVKKPKPIAGKSP